jgi:predicted MFS family arabinose efflux permease
MTNSRIALAVGLAAVSLALALTNAIGGVVMVAAGLAPIFGISAVVSATAAFILSWKQRSFTLVGLQAA